MLASSHFGVSLSYELTRTEVRNIRITGIYSSIYKYLNITIYTRIILLMF